MYTYARVLYVCISSLLTDRSVRLQRYFFERIERNSVQLHRTMVPCYGTVRVCVPYPDCMRARVHSLRAAAEAGWARA